MGQAKNVHGIMEMLGHRIESQGREDKLIKLRM